MREDAARALAVEDLAVAVVRGVGRLRPRVQERLAQHPHDAHPRRRTARVDRLGRAAARREVPGRGFAGHRQPERLRGAVDGGRAAVRAPSPKRAPHAAKDVFPSATPIVALSRTPPTPSRTVTFAKTSPLDSSAGAPPAEIKTTRTTRSSTTETRRHGGVRVKATRRALLPFPLDWNDEAETAACAAVSV